MERVEFSFQYCVRFHENQQDEMPKQSAKKMECGLTVGEVWRAEGDCCFFLLSTVCTGRRISFMDAKTNVDFNKM